ncbi:MAG: DUF956 family protein [Parolsenella sp.]|uniref:DUF956 family protein n=1 Tax=unclassified Parolsenella TaxID=2623992 RepID=UPI002A760852|nr:DUF956 family protein [Parolsenella sp.]MCI5949122.1 DUF956 family protein [Coriobacteriaceae bacterium]MDY3291962.1 DUF956 family protein [Parolsenella sp.]
MVQSQNTKVDYTERASSLSGLATYGDVMVGDRAFEFYNERNKEDFIQIPWDEVDYVAAEVLPGKKIVRFAIFTKENGHFDFSTRDNKATLRAMREHLPEDLLQRSPSLLDVLKAGVRSLSRLGR